MRKLLILLVLFGAVWSFNIAEYLSKNESSSNVSSQDLVGPDGAYVLYYVNNEPTLIVHNDEIVKNRDTVKVVLERYYFTKDFPHNDELKEIKAKALEFNESREVTITAGLTLIEPPEKMCWRYTGLVVRECDTIQKQLHPCIYACGASPICKGSILEGGITSQEHTTYDFLDAILNFQQDVKGIDNDVKIIVEYSDALSNLEYSHYNNESLKKLYNITSAAKDIKERYDRLKNNILFADLLEGVTGLQSYCPPLNYSGSAADELKMLANRYESQVTSLSKIDEIVDSLLNRTAFREQLKVRMKAENEYTKKYNDMDAKYNDLYSKYLKISKYVNDSSLKEDIGVLKFKRDSARDNIYGGNFSRADILIKEFYLLTDNLEKKINEYFEKATKIEELQDKAEKKIIIAKWDIEIDNVFLGQQLNDVVTKKNALDARIANKLSPEEMDNVTLQYSELVNEIDEIIEVKREHALDTVLNKVVVTANVYSNTLSSTYTSIVGGDYQHRKQVREYVLPVTLVIMDIVALGAFLTAFVYLVGSGRIRLHRIAAVMWSFIFIAFFTLVAGGSIGTYLLINEKINKATFDMFYLDLNATNETAVVIDVRNGAFNEECTNTLTKILSKQMNKTVYVYRYGLEGCTLEKVVSNETTVDKNEKKSIDACDEQSEKMPKMIFKKDDKDSTVFTIRYSTNAVIGGSDDYMKQCKLGVILSEEV